MGVILRIWCVFFLMQSIMKLFLTTATFASAFLAMSTALTTTVHLHNQEVLQG